jgi:hypothetical protein
MDDVVEPADVDRGVRLWFAATSCCSRLSPSLHNCADALDALGDAQAEMYRCLTTYPPTPSCARRLW